MPGLNGSSATPLPYLHIDSNTMVSSLASSVHLNTSSTLYWNSLEAKKCTCFGCSQQSD
jgi:hypothetical protein